MLEFLDWFDEQVKRCLKPVSNLWENETGSSHYYLASLIILSGISVDTVVSLTRSVALGLTALLVHWCNFVFAFALFTFGRLDDQGSFETSAVPSLFRSCRFLARWFFVVALVATSFRDFGDVVSCLLISAGYYIVGLPGIPREDRVSMLSTVLQTSAAPAQGGE